MGVECYVSAEELSVFVFDLRAAARREGAMEDAERGKFTEEVSRGGGRGWDKEYKQEDYVLKKQGTFSSKTRKDTVINEGRKEDSGLCECLSF